MTYASHGVPFDHARLDAIMDQHGLDVIIACSKPNVRYLLGGYTFFFFERVDAVGQSRYLPILLYARGRPERSAYIGHRMEPSQQENEPLWVPDVRNVSSGSADALKHAVAHLRRLGMRSPRIGTELAFLPADALRVLVDAFPDSPITDALQPLERLRARKTADEVEKLRFATDMVVEAMMAVLDDHAPGTTKREMVESLRWEEVSRGLEFDYCLITAGSSLNRAPSDQVVRAGDIVSLDSGGRYRGYIGDVCRMGIFGEPDAELDDLLAEVKAVQGAAVAAVRPGARGGSLFDRADVVLAASPNRECMEFTAHGMGLVSHEIPHLTDAGPVPYAAEDAERPLEAGIVLSVETTMRHPRRGFIKLEDTVLVKADGHEILGDARHGWNRSGLRLIGGCCGADDKHRRSSAEVVHHWTEGRGVGGRSRDSEVC